MWDKSLTPALGLMQIFLANEATLQQIQSSSIGASSLAVESLTLSTQAGLSIRLFFLRCCPKTWMNYWAGRSLTVKKVCLVSPIIFVVYNNNYYFMKNKIYNLSTKLLIINQSFNLSKRSTHLHKSLFFLTKQSSPFIECQMKSPQRRFLNILFLLSVFIIQSNSQPHANPDKIVLSQIKMFPQDYTHDIYAGFFNITDYGKSVYYFFFESQTDPDNDPVVLWLNGGPGCSSMIGMLTEHGPLLFKPGTTQMYINPYSWNKRANIIYLESPAGVGFGYASKSYKDTNDTQTAKDNLEALKEFFYRFPQYEGNDFYLAGQSYAGIYIPMLANQIIDFNAGDSQLKIKLRGMLLGNPCTHKFQCLTPTAQSRFFVQFLYTHGFFQQSLYNQYQGQCILSQQSSACVTLQRNLKNIFLNTGANIYNVYGYCYNQTYPPKGTFSPLGEKKLEKHDKMVKQGLKHPLRCSDSIGPLTLFNTDEFREGLHVYQKNDTLFWTPCAQDQDLNYEIDVGQTFRLLPILVKQDLKIMYYSGDQDAIVPLEGTKWWFQEYRNQFGVPIKKSWRPWISQNQNISGMVWQLQGITLATVIGAGHMVPTDKPAEAQQIFNIFLGYQEWKLPDYFQQ